MEEKNLLMSTAMKIILNAGNARTKADEALTLINDFHFHQAHVKILEAREDIKKVAIKRRDLKPIVANYLRQQFNLKKEEMAYYRTVSAINYEYWKVN